jgi:hypothetical protein
MRVPISQISHGPRKRPLDDRLVAELAKSIEDHCLLQPIGVVQRGDSNFELIFGKHRLEAFKLLQRETIPAVVFSSETTEDECVLYELIENLDRCELSGSQRKAFAAEAGRLITKMEEDSKPDGNSQWEKNWFLELTNKMGIPQNTLRNWWTAFTKETNLNITPKQALKIHREQFFDWLSAQKAKEDAAKAEKAKADLEEKEKREAEAKAKYRAEEFQEAIEYLVQLMKDWGREEVVENVIEPVLDGEN